MSWWKFINKYKMFDFHPAVQKLISMKRTVPINYLLTVTERRVTNLQITEEYTTNCQKMTPVQKLNRQREQFEENNCQYPHTHYSLPHAPVAQIRHPLDGGQLRKIDKVALQLYWFKLHITIQRLLQLMLQKGDCRMLFKFCIR